MRALHRNLALHPRADSLLDAAELQLPERGTDRHQGSPLREREVPADRDLDHGVGKECAAARLQSTKTDQRDHVRQYLRSDRESDALLLTNDKRHETGKHALRARRGYDR